MSVAIDGVLDRDIPKRNTMLNTMLTVVLSSFIGNTIE